MDWLEKLSQEAIENAPSTYTPSQEEITKVCDNLRDEINVLEALHTIENRDSWEIANNEMIMAANMLKSCHEDNMKKMADFYNKIKDLYENN